MLISERHTQIICELQKNPRITVKELAARLCFSEPTIRRDLTQLHNRGILTKCYGGAILNEGAADREIPFVLRENERSKTKAEIGMLAARQVSDGMVIMLDGSTSAYHLVPYLAKYHRHHQRRQDRRGIGRAADPRGIHRGTDAHQLLLLCGQGGRGNGEAVQRGCDVFLLPRPVFGGYDE